MGKKLRAIVAIAAGIMAMGAVGPTGPVSAGSLTTDVIVTVRVLAPDPATVLEALTVEVYEISGSGESLVPDDPCEPLAVFTSTPLTAIDLTTCEVLGAGDFVLGVDGVPDGAGVSGECSGQFIEDRIPGTSAEFTTGQGIPFIDCTVTVIQPALFVDKVVPDGEGTAGQDEFTIEVFGSDGEPVTAQDPSPALCGDGLPLTNCAVVPLPAGTYQLGEVPLPGYVPSNVGCFGFSAEFPYLNGAAFDVFPDGVGEFDLGDQPQGEFPFVQCEITNLFYEGDLIVEKVVVNDDGGTASAEDFTGEVYRDGSLEADGACNADGDCVAVTLPIGEYRIGESGPGGYTATVACTVTREPDGPPPIDTTPPTTVPTSTTMPQIIIELEAIPGDAALAQVEPFGEVTCVITNDDIPTTTTTLATTTTAATTTVPAPTTTDLGGQPVAPTTLAPTLPATGSDDTNVLLTIIALGMLLVGGSLVALRRR